MSIPPLAGRLSEKVSVPVVTDESLPQRGCGRYSKQFRKDAAALVIDQGRVAADVARELGVVAQWVGRMGSSQENAAAESFWATLTRELVWRWRFAARAEARRAIIAWIRRANAVRLHSNLGNVPPIEWELRYRLTELQAAEPTVRLAGEGQGSPRARGAHEHRNAVGRDPGAGVNNRAPARSSGERCAGQR